MTLTKAAILIKPFTSVCQTLDFRVLKVMVQRLCIKCSVFISIEGLLQTLFQLLPEVLSLNFCII